MLRARIRGRAAAEGPQVWCLLHLEVGLALMRDEAFGEAVPTDGRTPAEVTDAIIARLPRA